MKKLAMVAIALSGLVGSINAETMEDFFYKRGYEVGFDEGYKAGVVKAFEEAKQILVRYDNELKAFELGKYLIKAQNLTYPRVYQEKNENNEFKFVITQSEIQKEINVEELFSKFGSLPQIEPNLKQNNELSLDEKNSVYLSFRDNNTNDLPQNVSSDSNIKTLNIDKTSKNLEILKKANVVFSDENDRYNVLFFTEEEKKDFCKQFNICQ
ncbi:hypothetical protein [Campylobacter vicugnae]|uniref:hypothetical protein n=1 Tax=Campylobacter vicugnae TaxID=1660076 RepID=UPI000A349EF4|nr:hypothetical protein [Campylobacter sp. S0112]